MSVQSVTVKLLRPTQISVGYKLVKARRKGLRERERKPQELVDFIIENPIRVVAGPNALFFVIDHHHLGLALQDEGFDTAPVEVMGDFSHAPSMSEFWKMMEAKGWVYPVDGKGRKQPLRAIPRKLCDLEDDPYRSLAGFVRMDGGYKKSQMPYAEFLWADYFRGLIPAKLVKKDFDDALKWAMRLAKKPEASHLPGYVAPSPEKSEKKKNG